MKIRVTASWELETDSQEQTANEIKQKLGIENVHLRFDRIKTKVHKVRLGEFSVDDVFPYITKKDIKRDYTVDGVTYSVRMNSQRYFLFRQCPKCVSCGLVGTKMFLEQDSIDPHPHFNLYGEEDGKFLLLTKDHIYAKSCGGEDNHSNYQTLCVVCNNIKGNANLPLLAIKQLRKLYNDNKHLTKKKLNILINEEKDKLSRPWSAPPVYYRKLSMDALKALTDLNIFLINHELYAKAAYDEIPLNSVQIGCIRRGTILEPLVAFNKQMLCQFSDQQAFFVPLNLVSPVEK